MFMKIHLNKLLILGAAALLVVSCKKDETRAVVKAGTAPALSASNLTLTLTKATENASPTTFTYTPPDFGYQAAATYTLQFAKPGTNFANPYSLQLLDNKTDQALTGKALNIAALNAGLDTLSSQPVQVRLKADIGSGRAPVYSNVITLNVKPYSLNAYLYVPGDYQGWDPGSAPKIVSINSSGNYEGFVNIIQTGYLGFKLTDAPDWNHGIFGDANSSGTSGTIASPGSDIKIPSGGYYKINASFNTNSYSATKVAFSIIGDLTGWGSDLDMTYNATTQVWTATVNFPSTPGQFKFRANHDWGINYGDDGANGTPDLNGGNINGVAGSHVVTLDLHVPGAYTFSIQ
jgi:hypothetical protein